MSERPSGVSAKFGVVQNGVTSEPANASGRMTGPTGRSVPESRMLMYGSWQLRWMTATTCSPSFVKAILVTRPWMGLSMICLRVPVSVRRMKPVPASASLSPSWLYAMESTQPPSIGSGSPIRSWLEASKNRIPAAKSATATVFPSGLTAIARRTSSSPCMMPCDRRGAEEAGEQVAARLR